MLHQGFYHIQFVKDFFGFLLIKDKNKKPMFSMIDWMIMIKK